jgi:hypothetical protein
MGENVRCAVLRTSTLRNTVFEGTLRLFDQNPHCSSRSRAGRRDRVRVWRRARNAVTAAAR